MRQRIMIASAMLMQPALLIADEPTTALDALIQREVAQLMLDLTREQGAAAIMISHDLAMVAEFAHRVVVMERGRVVETGSSEEILLSPRHPYTRRLLDALPRRAPARVVPPASAPVVEVRDLVVDFPGRSGSFFRKGARQARGARRLAEGDARRDGGAGRRQRFGQDDRRPRHRRPRDARPVARCCFRAGRLPASTTPARQAWRFACQMVFQDPYGSLDPRMTVS